MKTRKVADIDYSIPIEVLMKIVRKKGIDFQPWEQESAAMALSPCDPDVISVIENMECFIKIYETDKEFVRCPCCGKVVFYPPEKKND